MTYAIVKSADSTSYISPLFAIKFDGLQSAAIGLDPSLSHVQKLDFWLHNEVDNTSTRNLFILSCEYEKTDTCWDGLDWFMNDKDLLERFLSGDTLPLAEDDRFSPYAVPITLPSWFEVQTDTHIRSLETVAFGFHDAKPIAYTETDTNMTVTLDTTWGCIITMRFCNVIEETFKEKVGLILDSKIEKSAVGFTFRVLEGFSGWIDEAQYHQPVQDAYIRCQKIFWKIEIDSYTQ